MSRPRRPATADSTTGPPPLVAQCLARLRCAGFAGSNQRQLSAAAGIALGAVGRGLAHPPLIHAELVAVGDERLAPAVETMWRRWSKGDLG